MDLIRFCFTSSVHHLIAVSETWLHPEIPDVAISLPGYSILRNDRVGKVGGGVALYVHDSIKAHKLTASPSRYHNAPEYLLVSIKPSGTNPVLVAVVYRPPKAANLSAFTIDFDALVVDFASTIILGDFNSNLLSSSYEASDVRDFCSERAMYVVPYSSTCHTHTSDTLLDLCILSDQSLLSSFSQSSAPFIACHDAIYVVLKIPNLRSQTHTYTSRAYRQLDQTAFCNDLASFDWSQLAISLSVDESVCLLSSHITTALNKHAPYITRCHSRTSPPWITRDLYTLRKARDRLYRAYRRSRTHIALLRYRDARDTLHKRISAARTNYYAARLSGIDNPNLLWRELRNLGIASSKRTNSTDFSLDELNQFFVKVAQWPSATVEVNDFISSLPPPTYSDQLFYFHDVSPDHLSSALLHFSSQSRGIDDLSLSDIGLSLPVTFPILLALFNRSLNDAVFPESWKRSRVIPLNKVSHPTSFDQTRPIANLCFLSKLLERLVLEQMVEYLEVNHLLDPYQSGYRPSYSTQTALLKLLEDTRRAVDTRKLTILVLFDFSKAFDTVPHARLLSKLRLLGFSTHVLRWVASYLTGRTQAVAGANGKLSRWLTLDRGVPQGSVLGPLLFMLFINDISHVLVNTRHLVYADDLQIYLHVEPSNLSSAIEQLNRDVNAVLIWATENALCLNHNKTQAIILGSAPFIMKLDISRPPPVLLNNAPLPYLDCVRNLGLFIDSKLTWSRQIELVSTKVHMTLRQLAASRQLLSKSLRQRLVTSLIFPIFDYCSVVYCNVAVLHSVKLQRLLNTCVRFVCGVRRCEHITPFRRELGWLKLSDRRLYHSLSLTYSLLRSGRPSYLRELLSVRVLSTLSAPRHERGELLLPSVRTECFKRSYSFAVADAWNKLPAEIRAAATLSSFKTQLYDYLFSTESERSQAFSQF